MKHTTKVLLTAIIIAITFSGCCSTVTESIVSNTTVRDTTLTPHRIIDTVYTYDEGFAEWINNELIRLYSENDSLRGRTPDTVRIREYLKSKPIIGMWDSVVVTSNGDSLRLEFHLRNAQGKFVVNIKPSDIKAQLHDTNTTKTQTKKPSWWDKFLDGLPYFFMGSLSMLIVVVVGYVAWMKFKPL